MKRNSTNVGDIMRYLRAAAVAAALTGISFLAACGGGGGGGSTPPVGNPGGPPPTTSTPSPGASTSPAVTPTPGTTPTPVTTPTPITTPTPVTTPTPGGTPTPPPSQTTLQVGNGTINGLDDQILSSAPNTHNNKGEGDLEPGDPGALPQGGGQGAAVDNIPTATTMSDNYHVHAYLGLFVNGQRIAIPDGVGMVNPFGDFNYNGGANPCTGGYDNFECYADAFYYMHTHDASGAIHMESPTPVCGKAAGFANNCDMSLFTLGNFLDIWGISLSANNFGAYSGPVSVYTSPLKYNPCNSTGGTCYTASNTYTLYSGDPHAIPLYSHTVVWIVVGTQPARPADLPNIEWWLSF